MGLIMRKPCNNCEKLCDYVSIYSKRGTYGCDNVTANSCEKYQKYQKGLKARQKYIEGDKITSISEFSYYIKDNDYVYWRGKIKHISWLISLQYQVLNNLISGGYISKAIKKDINYGNNENRN